MLNQISIALCTCNGELYLREQLESIANQTRLPDEVVVSDDCSTDRTLEIIDDFAATAAFPVRVHVNEQNVGSTKNFERAISLCEGNIIALSDQDDFWFPDKLRRIEDCFAREPQVGLVFADAEVVDEHLLPLGYRLWESIGFDDTRRKLMRTGRALDVLLPGWTVTGATMAFRANFRNLILEIPTDLPLIHDGWIALMISSVSDVSFIEEPLIKYRQHARQQIGAKQRKQEGNAPSGSAGVKEALRRRNSYSDLIEIATQAYRRLSQHREAYASDAGELKLQR